MAVETSGQEPKKITVSVIKADIGGWVGHSAIHPALIQNAQEKLATAKSSGVLVDYHVTACGDDLQLIMTHRYGVDCEAIHRLAWETFEAGTQVAKDLHLYGAGQDLLSDAFSGNVRGQGPGVAEMEIIERKSEPILIFMADKTSAGAWNLPLYKMFADPFTTAGLVIAPTLRRCTRGSDLRCRISGSTRKSPSTARKTSTTCSCSSARLESTPSSTSSPVPTGPSLPHRRRNDCRSSRASTSVRTTL
jgi:hypothetical protein